MPLAHCKKCNKYIKFEPRLRFLRSTPTERDISGGSWVHIVQNRSCGVPVPHDNRRPIDDVKYHQENPGLDSNIKNDGWFMNDPE